MLRTAMKCAAVMLTAGWIALPALAQNIQQGDVSVELQLVATVQGGSNVAPNFGAHFGDPRFLYIGQQNGRIRILDFDQPNPLLGTDFLNIASALGTTFTSVATGERGLLGGAFHPDFNNPGMPGFGKFYTYTSETIATPTDFTHPEIGNGGNHQSVIREWTAGAPTAQGVITIDTGIASRVLMRINQPQSNHNAGALAFGPDNYLYIALGDGGGGNDHSGGVNNPSDGHTNTNNPDAPAPYGFVGHGNAQDRRNVFGTILRIQPTTDADSLTTPSANGQYRIPNDNPFTAASNPPGNQIPGWQENWVDEVFAYGLRNPFRMGFDRDTGELYAADVGQNQGISREEVNRIVNGGNYGWVIKEGTLTTSFNYPIPEGTTLIDPIGQYPTGSGGGIAVIGGYVYRGDQIPDLQGKYVFADLSRSGVPGGGLLYMDIDEPGALPNGLNQVFDLDITGPLAKPGSNIHGVAEDANGEIYFLFNNGQVIRLAWPFLPGDANRDGRVDGEDFLIWQASFGMQSGATWDDGDFNGDGRVDGEDFLIWQAHFGTVAGSAAVTPEPSLLALLPLAGLLRRRGRRAATR